MKIVRNRAAFTGPSPRTCQLHTDTTTHSRAHSTTRFNLSSDTTT